jgi:hypothetical protein
MVRIRYSELPVGLHVTAVAVGRQTIVYLLPGLTPAERQSALLRVRSSARMGHGPSLPAFALTRAVAADRLRAGVHTFAAVMRRHPLLLVPFAALVSSITVLVLVSAIPAATPRLTATVTPRPAASTPSIWRAFARYPVPVAESHSVIRFRHHRRHHNARSRPGAAQSRGGYQTRRDSLILGTAGARPQHRSGHHRSRQDRLHSRWRRPAPCHIGNGNPDQAARLLAGGRSATAIL